MNIILESALEHLDFITHRHIRIPPSQERELVDLLKLGLELEKPMVLTEMPNPDK